MAKAEPPPPHHEDRDAQHSRQDRSDRVLLFAILLSLLVHAALLVIAALFGRRDQPEPVAPDPPVVLRFIDTPKAEPPPEPPVTEFVSEQDSVARSPEPDLVPEPAPAPRVVERPPVPPQPRPQPQLEPVEEPPEEQPPVEESGPEKRARLEEVLRGLRNPNRPWSEAAQDAPPLPQGAVGGDTLQFESKADIDWGPYAARIKRIVRSNWRIPVAAQQGIDGITQVHFFIRRDGGIEELEVRTPSGTIPLDISARDAIALSDALPPPPLPANLDEERVGITWTFLYNIDDREWRQWLRTQRLAERAAARE